MYYGNTDVDKNVRPNRKFYSWDGSMQIKRNVTTGEVEFITFIGGDSYSSSVILKNNGNGLNENYYFLHRDYQGSILAVTNSVGQIVEKRLFDAWGQLIKLQDGNNNNLTKFNILDNGYTGHEHLLSVGLINMNGRIYDPKLHRFISPDNNVQDLFNTQNYNRYGYGLNNPYKYTDPSGESWLDIIGFAVSFFVHAGSASGGEINHLKWDSNAWTSGLSGATSSFASYQTTSYVNNYLDSYNNYPEINNNITNNTVNVTLEDTVNFFTGIDDKFHQGLNDRIKGTYNFWANKFNNSLYWAETISQFGSDIKNQRTLLDPSHEYMNEIGNNILNKSVYDWAYTAGYSTPDIAASFVVPVALEKAATSVGSMQVSIYRVYGDGAQITGKSFSLINPEFVPNYRNFAGLPNVNSGEFLLKGTIQFRDLNIGRWFAQPYNGNIGGLPFELYQNYNQLNNPIVKTLKNPF